MDFLDEFEQKLLDPDFKRRFLRAIDAVWTVAQEDNLTFQDQETVRRLAYYLRHHRDPEIREFQRKGEEMELRRRNYTN